jgi:hypothetical protein
VVLDRIGSDRRGRTTMPTMLVRIFMMCESSTVSRFESPCRYLHLVDWILFHILFVEFFCFLCCETLLELSSVIPYRKHHEFVDGSREVFLYMPQTTNTLEAELSNS